MSGGLKLAAATNVGCRNFRKIDTDRNMIRDRVILGCILINLRMLLCISKEVFEVRRATWHSVE